MAPTEVREGAEFLTPVTVIETKDMGNVIVESAGERWTMPMASLKEFAEAADECESRLTNALDQVQGFRIMLEAARADHDALAVKVLALEEAGGSVPEEKPAEPESPSMNPTPGLDLNA